MRWKYVTKKGDRYENVGMVGMGDEMLWNQLRNYLIIYYGIWRKKIKLQNKYLNNSIIKSLVTSNSHKTMF